MSAAEVGQRHCVLTPDLYNLLTVELGWTAQQHQKWVTDLLRRDLLRERRQA